MSKTFFVIIMPSTPPQAAAQLHRSFSTYGKFVPAHWFYAQFEELPRSEAYQLKDADARETIENGLAEIRPLDQSMVVQQLRFAEAGETPYLNYYALTPASHLLVYFDEDGPYDDQGVQLFFSASTDAGLLTQVRTLLAAQLKDGKTERTRIQVLRLRTGDLEFSPLPLKIPALDLAANYNDDLLPVHEAIVKRLQKPDDKGLVILHGPPGTGKTSYIRHLCGLTDKPKLFIPPNLALRIADPEFINLLHDNTNSILLIEDAEELLTKRDATGSNAVSNC